MGKPVQTAFAFAFLVAVASACLIPDLDAVYADMHDGDQKEVTISGSTGKMTIKPSGNNQSWVVNTILDTACQAKVDFNVPGKPNPPPVSLTASLWFAISSGGGTKLEFEFTDPSGTLPAGPLNRWVQLGQNPAPAVTCPTYLQSIYADMHDGDKKEITISAAAMTIKPSGNNQTWVVKGVLDAKSCSAVIDFNVPGKPNPPPVKLLATLWGDVNAYSQQEVTEFEFTDPSGTLAAKDFPLNHWVSIAKGVHDVVV